MKYNKYIVLSLILTTLLLIGGCSKKEENANSENTVKDEKVKIAVSIIPQETFVKAVGKDLVEVTTMIPPGHSPANYEPTPKEMIGLSNASMYFAIGVPTEKANILTRLEDLNEDIKIINLQDEVGKVYEHRNFSEEEEHDHESHEEEGVHEDHGHESHEEEGTHKDHGHESHEEEGTHEDHDHESHEEEGTHEDHNHEGVDPHIWLSPKRVKIMVNTIKDNLIEVDPQNKNIYEENAKSYIEKLDKVDKEIKESLKGTEEKSFIIYHPSFGYFADDYNLNMITIEENGKEATAKRLKKIIDHAKDENIKFIFYQEEFHSEQAETIGKEIGAEVIEVSPLAPNYIDNMRNMAEKFNRGLN
ncbi:metal ABC transporter solute-binding protein, Zn/Mn family [Anaeromicrobium sediminis]|uniref:ABC transporter substrate-binding protein n=1 Tax=Anaeromicrobium sediminis TaxID=1478221 RepID=A0A267ME79_9FIRM|nr:zinc ABC transporter substrate-binding protein [Anaeromicrobium sediminis]PAB57228.1 hypothetical protein CCE28_19275 [Anaeromicrobium sediminis]